MPLSIVEPPGRIAHPVVVPRSRARAAEHPRSPDLSETLVGSEKRVREQGSQRRLTKSGPSALVMMILRKSILEDQEKNSGARIFKGAPKFVTMSPSPTGCAKHSHRRACFFRTYLLGRILNMLVTLVTFVTGLISQDIFCHRRCHHCQSCSKVSDVSGYTARCHHVTVPNRGDKHSPRTGCPFSYIAPGYDS